MGPLLELGRAAPLGLIVPSHSGLALLAAALFFVAFYSLLGWPEEGWRGGAGRRALFAALGTLALAFSTRGPVATERTTSRDAIGQRILAVQAGYQAYSIGVLRGGRTPSQARADAIGGYERLIRAAPEAVRSRLELAVLLLDASRAAEARAQVNAALALLREREPVRAAEWAALWDRVLAETPPAPAEATAIEVEARRLYPRFFAALLAANVAQRTGDADRAKLLRNEARRIASQSLARALAAQTVIGVLLGIGAFGTIAALVLLRHRVFRRSPIVWHAIAPVLWEGFLLYLFLTQVPGWLAAIMPPGADPVTRSRLVLAVNLLADVVALLAIVCVVVRIARLGLPVAAELGVGVRRWWAEIGWGAAAYPVVLATVMLLALALEGIFRRVSPAVPDVAHPVIELVGSERNLWALIGWAIVAVVAAAALEEFFFRGLLYGAIRRRMHPVFAIPLSAGFFAALHPQGGTGLVAVFLLGCALAGLYEWRRSLWPGVVLHALNNGVILWATLALFAGLG